MAIRSPLLSSLKPEEREALMKRLYERQNHVCFLCDEKIDFELQCDDLEIDHIIPLAKEGKDEENNFALTHSLCNRQKGPSDLRIAKLLILFSRFEEEAKKIDVEDDTKKTEEEGGEVSDQEKWDESTPN